MKKIKDLRIIIVMLLCVFTYSSCGDNDDTPINLNTILGTWHSYKMIGYAQGEKVSMDISKTGNGSEAYIEITFYNNGQYIGHAWETDENGVSRWSEEKGTYTIKDNIVTIFTDDTISTLTYDEKEKALYIRGSMNYPEIGNVTIFIYLRK